MSRKDDESERQDIPRGRREHTPRTRDKSPQAESRVTDPSRSAAARHEEPYAVWSSERAFVLSTAAAGVGLGNLWRFPNLAGENGGGAFLVAYAIAVVLVAIPFGVLEIAIGRETHGSTIASFRHLGRRLAVFGWGVVALTLVIDSYYFVVSGWTLGYALEATTLGVPDFDAFTAGYRSLWYLLAMGLLVGAVLAFGLSGIERVARWLMPVLVVALAGIAVFSLSNGGGDAALAFLFQPDTAKFADMDVWRAAFGQAFYSLTIGQGYLITYGSYLPPRTNVLRSVSAVATMNAGVAILAGLAIFPLVFAAGLEPAAGSKLAFTTLPLAFESFGGGEVLLAVFFWLFFLAAFSSCIGGAKVVVAALREQQPRLSARLAVGIGVGAIVALGLPSALSYAAPDWTVAGRPVLDFLDRLVGSNGVIVVAVGTALILGWRYSHRHLGRQFGLHRPAAWVLTWFVRVVPLALAVLFVAF